MSLPSSAVYCPWEDHIDRLHKQQSFLQPLFQTNVILCESWNTMLSLLCKFQLSDKSQEGQRENCYLSR